MAAYDGILRRCTAQLFFIFIGASNTIDINIHPTKTEMFDDEHAHFKSFYKAIMDSLM
jgi:DNA mismatch repair ATPase MutL